MGNVNLGVKVQRVVSTAVQLVGARLNLILQLNLIVI